MTNWTKKYINYMGLTQVLRCAKCVHVEEVSLKWEENALHIRIMGCGIGDRNHIHRII